jgi:hypothetical protein
MVKETEDSTIVNSVAGSSILKSSSDDTDDGTVPLTMESINPLMNYMTKNERVNLNTLTLSSEIPVLMTSWIG